MLSYWLQFHLLCTRNWRQRVEHCSSDCHF